jgi:hypothetical protein
MREVPARKKDVTELETRCGLIRSSSSLARVIATYSSRRSPSAHQPALVQQTVQPSLPLQVRWLSYRGPLLTRIRVFKIKQIHRCPQRVDVGVILIQSPVLGMGE